MDYLKVLQKKIEKIIGNTLTEDEVIELIKMDIDTAYHKVVNGEIFDSKTMIAILHAYINKNKS